MGLKTETLKGKYRLIWQLLKTMLHVVILVLVCYCHRFGVQALYMTEFDSTCRDEESPSAAPSTLEGFCTFFCGHLNYETVSCFYILCVAPPSFGSRALPIRLPPPPLLP